ncbi:MAG TPA: hypothetical protein VF680_11500 [Allosphingosinicella sp.]|jgi:translation initiation factor IF-2
MASHAAFVPSFPAAPRRLGNNGRWPQWTAEEDARLRTAYEAGEPLDEVAAELERPIKGVRSRALAIGVAGKHAKGRGGFAIEREWTAMEDERIREAYGKVPTAALALELSRPQGGVYQRAWRLGIKHGSREVWSRDEREALRIAHERGIALSDAVIALGRNYQAVAKIAQKRGFRFGTRPSLLVPPTLADLLALEDTAVPLPPVRAGSPYRLDGEGRPRAVRQPELWPAEKQDRFLEALEQTGSIEASLAAVGLKPISRKAAYRQKHRNPDFSTRWDAALKASPYRPGPKPRPKAPAAPRVPATPKPTTARRRPDTPGRRPVEAARPAAQPAPAPAAALRPTPAPAQRTPADRLQLIREIGQRLQSPAPAVRPGASWVENRIGQVERAKAFLREKGCRIRSASDDRFTYYVTGLAGEYTGAQLVEIAAHRGMELPA